MVPEVFVSDELKRARRMAEAFVKSVKKVSGCHAFCLVAEADGPRLRTAIAEDASLEADAETEERVLGACLSRVVSLLVLQRGQESALHTVMRSFQEGRRLAREAQSHCARE